MKKQGFLFIFIIIAVSLFTGCSSINLSSRQEDLISEYAADALLQSEKYYNKKLLKQDEIEIETETQTQIEDETDTTDDGSGVSIAQVLGLNDFLIEYTSYEISDTYTEAVVAGDGMKVIVLKFDATNISGDQATFDLEKTTLKYTYKGTFNGTYSYNAQITLLLNALNSYKGDFEDGETKEIVLIFKAPTEQLVDGISEISITITTDQNSNTIKLQ